MTKRRYVVNWSDQFFPEIKLIEDMDGYDQSEAVTLAEAKDDIISSFQGQIEHARFVIRQTRARRARDIHADSWEKRERGTP